MNHSGDKAMKKTWQPIRTGAFILGMAIALGACQREEEKETTTVPPSAPTTPGAEDEGTTTPIRDVDSIITAPDRTANLNRQAELTNTGVQRVANERVFWVGTATDRAIPVYIDDDARRSLPADQQRLNAGDRVTVIGEIRRAPSTDDLQRQWKLSAQDAEQVNKAQVYVHAKQIALLKEEPVMPGEPPEQPKEQPRQPGQAPGQPGQAPGQPGKAPGQPGQAPGQSPPGQSGEFRPDQPSQHPSHEAQLGQSR